MAWTLHPCVDKPLDVMDAVETESERACTKPYQATCSHVKREVKGPPPPLVMAPRGWLCRRPRCAEGSVERANRCRSGFLKHPRGCYEAVYTGGAGYGAVRAMRSAAFSGQMVVVPVFSALDVMRPCARLGLARSPSALCAKSLSFWFFLASAWML